MEYRIHPRTGDKISVIGIGTGPIFETTEREAAAALTYAYEQGVNYLDFATAGAKTFPYVGAALGSVRKELLYQIHFGADYTSGEYGWSLDLDTVKRQVDWQLRELKTDYIDFGMIHCLDEEKDWRAYQENGVLDYLLELKRAGVVRHIGLSSHTPELARKILDTRLVEQLMFSINPAYDCQQGEYAVGSAGERMDLYRRCQAEGIGLSVMKPFSAGQLLDGKTSPFGRALTKVQCIQYALDRPGVLTVLPGIRNLQDMKEALAWHGRSGRGAGLRGPRHLHTEVRPQAPACTATTGAPCPAGAEHRPHQQVLRPGEDRRRHGRRTTTKRLEKHASDCVACGHCDGRCPFRVRQSDRMRQIAAYFGR